MKIVFKRAQARHWLLWWRVIFRLWCELELENDERAVIDHYRFDKAVLMFYSIPNLFRAAVNFAVPITVAAFFVWGYFLGRHTGDILTVLTGLFAGWWFYDRHRKTIFVRDLVYGRNFRAGSVEQLIMYEEMLSKGAAYMRRLMEAAKNWDGSEISDVPAFDDNMVPKIIIKDFM